MGRKKKRHNKALIFCYYCDRKFESERVLIQHQRAKHFKCPQCHKRISSAHGMMLHAFQVHKETIEKVPASKEGRDGFDIEIFGMDGVPQDVIDEKRMKVFGEVPAKRPKLMPMGGSMGAAQVLLPGAPTSTMPIRMAAPPMMGAPMMMPGMMPGYAPMMTFIPGMPPGARPMGSPYHPGLPPPPPAPAGFQSGSRPPSQDISPPARQQMNTGPVGPPSTGPPGGEAGAPPKTGRFFRAPPPQPVHQNIPPIYATNSQPFGGYAQPMPVMPNPAMAAMANAVHAMPAAAPVMSRPGKKNKNVFRVYDDELVSMEEKRAMHPKYSAHLRKRITSLEDSINARIQALASN